MLFQCSRLIGFYMFSATSNAPVSNVATSRPELNEDKTLHYLMNVYLDVLEEQNCLTQGLSNDAVVDGGRTGSKTMNDFNFELADEFEMVLARVKKSNGRCDARNADEGSSLTAARSARCSDTEYTCNTRHTTQSIRPYYECNKCFKRFSCSSNLSRHEVSHESNNSKYCFRCVSCNKAFARRINLESHMKIHNGKGSSQCSLRGRSFSRWIDLKNHERVHRNRPSWSCNICHKRFADKFGLVSHMISHTDERPHKCSMCDKCYKRKSDLRRHVNVSHHEQYPL